MNTVSEISLVRKGLIAIDAALTRPTTSTTASSSTSSSTTSALAKQYTFSSLTKLDLSFNLLGHTTDIQTTDQTNETHAAPPSSSSSSSSSSTASSVFTSPATPPFISPHATRFLSSLINLRTLSLVGNNLNDLTIFTHCTCLQHLHLSLNNFSGSLSPLSSLRQLQTLSISRNLISNLGNLPPNLQELDISHNQLTTLEGLATAPALRILDISFNVGLGSASIVESNTNLVSNTSSSNSSSRITSGSRGSSNISSRVTGTSSSALSLYQRWSDVRKLTNLDEFLARGLGLISIPWLGKAAMSLTLLDLSNNNIKDIAGDIDGERSLGGGPGVMSSLCDLILNDNNIESIKERYTVKVLVPRVSPPPSNPSTNSNNERNAGAYTSSSQGAFDDIKKGKFGQTTTGKSTSINNASTNNSTSSSSSSTTYSVEAKLLSLEDIFPVLECIDLRNNHIFNPASTPDNTVIANNPRSPEQAIDADAKDLITPSSPQGIVDPAIVASRLHALSLLPSLNEIYLMEGMERNDGKSSANIPVGPTIPITNNSGQSIEIGLTVAKGDTGSKNSSSSNGSNVKPNTNGETPVDLSAYKGAIISHLPRLKYFDSSPIVRETSVSPDSGSSNRNGSSDQKKTDDVSNSGNSSAKGVLQEGPDTSDQLLKDLQEVERRFKEMELDDGDDDDDDFDDGKDSNENGKPSASTTTNAPLKKKVRSKEAGKDSLSSASLTADASELATQMQLEVGAGLDDDPSPSVTPTPTDSALPLERIDDPGLESLNLIAKLKAELSPLTRVTTQRSSSSNSVTSPTTRGDLNHSNKAVKSKPNRNSTSSQTSSKDNSTASVVIGRDGTSGKAQESKATSTATHKSDPSTLANSTSTGTFIDTTEKDHVSIGRYSDAVSETVEEISQRASERLSKQLASLQALIDNDDPTPITSVKSHSKPQPIAPPRPPSSRTLSQPPPTSSGSENKEESAGLVATIGTSQPSRGSSASNPTTNITRASKIVEKRRPKSRGGSAGYSDDRVTQEGDGDGTSSNSGTTRPTKTAVTRKPSLADTLEMKSREALAELERAELSTLGLLQSNGVASNQPILRNPKGQGDDGKDNTGDANNNDDEGFSFGTRSLLDVFNLSPEGEDRSDHDSIPVFQRTNHNNMSVVKAEGKIIAKTIGDKDEAVKEKPLDTNPLLTTPTTVAVVTKEAQQANQDHSGEELGSAEDVEEDSNEDDNEDPSGLTIVEQYYKEIIPRPNSDKPYASSSLPTVQLGTGLSTSNLASSLLTNRPQSATFGPSLTNPFGANTQGPALSSGNGTDHVYSAFVVPTLPSSVLAPTTRSSLIASATPTAASNVIVSALARPLSARGKASVGSTNHTIPTPLATSGHSETAPVISSIQSSQTKSLASLPRQPIIGLNNRVSSLKRSLP